jgi:phenylacetate-CoA ligase
MLDDSFESECYQLLSAIEARKLVATQRSFSADLTRSFLRHAAATVPYYKSLFGGQVLESLNDFPIVSRELIASNPWRFCSGAFNPDSLLETRTSGTSGRPLSVFRDQLSCYTMYYDTFAILFRKLPELACELSPATCAGIVVTDNPERQPTVTVNPSLGLSYVRRIIIGISDEIDQEQIAYVFTETPPLITGRPRALLRLIELSKMAPSTSKVKAVVCSGDNLDSDDRRKIETAFEAPVYDAYASQEGGLIALEGDDHRGLRVLKERAVVEVIEPKAGQLSIVGTGELAVTNLENWGMPIIRYRTGDVAALSECRVRDVQVIQRIQGRVSVYFDVDGKKFNPSQFNDLFESLSLKQFQVKQGNDLELTVVFVPNETSEPGLIIEQIHSGIHERFGKFPRSVMCVGAIGRAHEKIQRYVRDHI